MRRQPERDADEVQFPYFQYLAFAFYRDARYCFMRHLNIARLESGRIAFKRKIAFKRLCAWARSGHEGDANLTYFTSSLADAGILRS